MAGGCSIETSKPTKKTKGSQWKDNVHTFHLIPSSTQCDQLFGHSDAFKNLQIVDVLPCLKANLVLKNGH